jgi:hypothetical protein
MLAERRRTAVDLSDRAYFPWVDNDEPRWWRPPDTLKADLARALEPERTLSADLASALERERTLSADLAGARERERVLSGVARASEEERALSTLAGSLREIMEQQAVHVGKLEHRETELRQSLEHMIQSRSWRYVEPIRRLLSWLRGKRAG